VYLRVIERAWYFSKKKTDRVGYAVMYEGKRKTYMQNFIMRTDSKLDHINGDGLDNRRENLRRATSAQNTWNSRKSTRTSNPYKGVSRSGKKWVASICKNYTPIRIGLFETPEKAALAYDAKARELFGEFAKTNFEASK
jgi:hypothetical protein